MRLSSEEHLKILDAVGRGDRERAALAMIRHLRRAAAGRPPFVEKVSGSNPEMSAGDAS